MLVVVSVRAKVTVAVSPVAKIPFKLRLNWALAPSSMLLGPVIDHTATSSSSIVVVSVPLVNETLGPRPVLLVALLRSIRKFSSPSVKPSATVGKVTARSAIGPVPSLSNEIVPVAESNTTVPGPA